MNELDSSNIDFNSHAGLEDLSTVFFSIEPRNFGRKYLNWATWNLELDCYFTT